MLYPFSGPVEQQLHELCTATIDSEDVKEKLVCQATEGRVGEVRDDTGPQGRTDGEN